MTSHATIMIVAIQVWAINHSCASMSAFSRNEISMKKNPLLLISSTVKLQYYHTQLYFSKDKQNYIDKRYTCMNLKSDKFCLKVSEFQPTALVQKSCVCSEYWSQHCTISKEKQNNVYFCKKQFWSSFSSLISHEFFINNSYPQFIQNEWNIERG